MLIYENYTSKTKTAVRADMSYTFSVLVSAKKTPVAVVNENMPAVAAAAMYALAVLGLADAFGRPVAYETYTDEFEHNSMHDAFRHKVVCLSIPCHIPDGNGYRMEYRIDTLCYVCLKAAVTDVFGIYLKNSGMECVPGLRMKGGMKIYDTIEDGTDGTDVTGRRCAKWNAAASGDIKTATAEYYASLSDDEKRNITIGIITNPDNDMCWEFSESWHKTVTVIGGESSDTDIYTLSVNNWPNHAESYNDDVRTVPPGVYPVIIKINMYGDKSGCPDMADACFTYMECMDNGEIVIYAPRIFTAYSDRPFDTDTAVKTMMTLTGQPREYCVKFISEIITHYYGNDYADFG